MEGIIVCQSAFKLRRFLLRMELESLQEARYLEFSMLSRAMVHLLRAHGVQAVEQRTVPSKRKEAILRDYIGALGLMAEWNGDDPHWWATDISSRNRFRSPLPPILNDLVRFIITLEDISNRRRSLFLVAVPRPVVAVLSDLTQSIGLKMRVIGWPWSKFASRLRGQIKACGILWYGARTSFRRIREVRKYFTRGLPDVPNDRSVYLIKSFVFPHSFGKNGQYRDPFFGELPQFIRHRLGKKVKVLTVAQAIEERPLCYKKMTAAGEEAPVPLEAFITHKQVIRAMLSLFLSRFLKPFRVKGRISFLGYDISNMFIELLRCGGWHIQTLQYLHGSAGAAIGRKYRAAACAFTYEGNPWERQFLSGLKSSRPDTFFFGYQHAVVPMAAAGVFLDDKETYHLALPDRILTTGKIPEKLMKAFARIPQERTQTGCALRYDYLHGMENLPRRSPPLPFRVLVALEGVEEVIPLVDYALKQAQLCDGVIFRIRSHPALPLERIVSRTEFSHWSLRNIEVSEPKSVPEEIRGCDVVLYWGTTLALEAIMMGRPVIHFDRGDVLSYDPLFALECFKWAVSAQDDLLPILRQILQLPDKIYNELSDTARRYVKAYFQPVNEEAMGSFLPREV